MASTCMNDMAGKLFAHNIYSCPVVNREIGMMCFNNPVILSYIRRTLYGSKDNMYVGVICIQRSNDFMLKYIYIDEGHALDLSLLLLLYYDLI